MDIKQLRLLAEERLAEVEREYRAEGYHPPAFPRPRWRPSHAIRDGQGILLLRKRPVRTGIVHMFVASDSMPVVRFVCRPRKAKRVAGRVNHATVPLRFWWLDGLGRKNFAMWNMMRAMKGEDGRRVRPVPAHKLRRDAMSSGWLNYRDNLEEMHLVSHRPRPGEFHLLGARMLARSRTMKDETA